MVYHSHMADYSLPASAISMPLAGKVGEVSVVLVAVSLAIFALRYGWLLVRARTPRVQLSSIELATQETRGEPVDQRWVRSLLREQLNGLRLSATEALPNASTGPPLLEIVEGIGEGIGDKSQLGRAVGRLFRAIFPEAAYEVSGTIRPVDGAGKTISVQVVDRTHRHRTWVGTGRGDSWSEAARNAAAGIAGALYPQVANRHKGPWASWRKPVPARLVMLNDEARRHEKGNRLEQAMGTYLDALEMDPLNPGLRLRIAMLQERLDLYLGAWATYRAIADETHRNSWKGGNRRVRLLALYRMAILLGNKRVAEHWVCKTPDPSENRCKAELRDSLKAERPLIRASWWNRSPLLRKAFPIRFVRTSPTRLLDQELSRADGLGGAGITSIAAARERRGGRLNKQLHRLEGETENKAETRIRLLLEIVSLIHLEQLNVRLRRKPPWRLWRWGDWWRYRPAVRHTLTRRELSLSAVRVSKLVARIRIVASVERRMKGERAGESPPGRRDRRRAERARERLRRPWPFKVTPWRQPARWLRPRHRVADRREDAWQYHYNAACAVSQALPAGLKPDDDKRPRKQVELLEAGILQLEEYVHRAGGDLVLAQAVWVAREDPDLRALRKTAEYRQWSRHHLPSSDSQSRASSIDTARIAARIAHRGACAFAERWRARSEDAPADAETLAELWRREAEAWTALIELFGKHASWKARLQGIATLQACLEVDGETDLQASHAIVDREGSDDLSEVLDQLRGNGSGSAAGVSLESVASWAQRRAARASIAARRGLNGRVRPRSQRHDARRAVRIWDRFAEALQGELGDNGKSPRGECTREFLVATRTELRVRGGGQLANRPRIFLVGAADLVRR